MREIKFRALNVRTGFWFEQDEVVLCDGHWYEDWRCFEDGWHLIMEDCAVMQCTGLKDENGNDVYQGDVIDVFYEDCPMGYYRENHLVGVVDLDKTGTAWVIKNAKYDFDMPGKMPNEIGGLSISVDLPDEEALEEIFLHEFNLEPEDILILGNIYENPELLEVSNGQN